MAEKPQDAASDLKERILWLVQHTDYTQAQAAAIVKQEPAGTAVDAAVDPKIAKSVPPVAGAKVTTPETPSLLTFTAAKGLKNYVKQFEKLPSTPDPSFIKGGGSKAQRAAYARSLANKTIKAGMSAADVAAIRQARLWYTGQTGGRTGKGKAGDAKFATNSVKAQRLALEKPTKSGTKSGSGTKPPRAVLQQNRAGTTAQVAEQERQRNKQKPKPKPNPGQNRAGTTAQVKAAASKPAKGKATTSPGKKPQKRYGASLGVNPESKTAGRKATTPPPAKQDRYKGRKSPKGVQVPALPGASGSLEFATAAVARNKAVAEKLKKRKEAKPEPSRNMTPNKRSKHGKTLVFPKRVEQVAAALQGDHAADAEVIKWLTPKASAVGKGQGQQSKSAQSRATARSLAKTSKDLAEFGYKPKKPKKSGFGGGR